MVDHEGPSYAVAVDKQSGEELWKADRGTRSSSWTSPLVASPFGEPWVVLSSCETVEVLDGATGRRLWGLRGFVGNRIPSAGAWGGRVFVGACEAEHIPMDPRDVSRSNCCLKLTPAGGRLSGAYLFLKEGEVAVIKAGSQFELVASNRVWNEDEAGDDVGDTQPVPTTPELGLPAGRPPLPPPGGAARIRAARRSTWTAWTKASCGGSLPTAIRSCTARPPSKARCC